MKDKGIVISTKSNLAQVKVNCFQACDGCSARSLCVGHKNSKGILSVKNPMKAAAGDEVRIEVPESKYSKSLILLFGSLLIASLAGMIVGSLIADLVPLSSSEASLLGLVCGIILAGFLLFRYFHKKNREQLYPVITEIIKKGDNHG